MDYIYLVYDFERYNYGLILGNTILILALSMPHAPSTHTYHFSAGGSKTLGTSVISAIKFIST